MDVEAITAAIGAVVGAVATWQGRNAWFRHARRRDEGIPRCPNCYHRCTWCRSLAIQNSGAPKGHGPDDTPPSYRHPRR